MSNDNKIRTGLWKKEGNNGPYYSGKVEIGGQKYFVDLYKNDRKETDSQPDLNLQLKPMEASGNGSAPQRTSQPAPKNDFVDDDLNF